ncbi:MAG: hypothetical protein IJI41_00565 [Anaerolineaceae bacterium]|nr:hypothetical protein [Anaerolineaceae bacterium]
MKMNKLSIILSVFIVFCFSFLIVNAQNTCDCADLLERIEKLELILLPNNNSVASPVLNSTIPSGNDTQTGNGLTVTLLESLISNGILTATFRIDNVSNQDKSLSSLMDWSAKDGDGENLVQQWLDSTLDGTLIPGDFMKGKVVFKGVKSTPVHLQFNSDLFGGTILHFYVQ